MSPKLKWTLLCGAFLLVGLVALIVGFQLSGFDVLGWFSTKYAFIVYVVVGAYLFFVIWLAVNDYIKR